MFGEEGRSVQPNPQPTLLHKRLIWGSHGGFPSLGEKCLEKKMGLG